ncbi:hypothetical protein EDD37DRAFT_667835 [Exophiala viscosa]|uniref:uncharacterized protein n=1 Tax=Exophiala viscosa TaxID=2486360 RepID=UPI00219F0CE1|nr:hypothetical protein EDD37DRAFT_667835 [Exophiala viscosa]
MSSHYSPIPNREHAAHGFVGQPLPTTRGLKVSLIIIFLFYGVLGGVGIWFAGTAGRSWDGDTENLTTVLAILGAIFSYGARELQSKCQTARMQYLVGKGAAEAVSLKDIHEMDMAIRGPSAQILSTGLSPMFYRLLFPILAILMSAVFKKALTTALQASQVVLDAKASTLLDPVDVGNGIRGSSWPGAILYNSTSSLGSGFNPAQSAWTYIVANRSDASGVDTVEYLMPCMPALVASGSAGYLNASITDVPMLSVTVRCGPTYQVLTGGEGSIQNSNNAIELFGLLDGTALIQISTGTDTAWQCTAALGTTTGSAFYVSDMSGNWNYSSTVTDSVDL